jgi:hypothetical protein
VTAPFKFLLIYVAVGLICSTSAAFDPRSIKVVPDRATVYGKLALQAATAAYSVPDLESVKSAANLQSDYETLIASAPDGYRVLFLDADLVSGLKLVMLAPSESDASPFILAIAGTASIVDWAANINLGVAQLERLQRTLDRIFEESFPEDGRTGRELIVTGHSLGGGLAQAVAFQLDQGLQSARIPGSIYVITWNAFGAKELIRRVVANHSSATLRIREQWHYYVRGDFVSRIGVHTGNTLELRAPVGANEPVLANTDWMEKAHALAMIRDIVRADAGALRKATKKAPPPLGPVSKLGALGPLFARLPQRIFNRRHPKIIHLLGEQLDEFSSGPIARAKTPFAEYVGELGGDVLDVLASNGNSSPAARALEQKVERFRDWQLSATPRRLPPFGDGN